MVDIAARYSVRARLLHFDNVKFARTVFLRYGKGRTSVCFQKSR